MILFSKHLVPKGYTGLAFFPFVFLKDKRSETDFTLINHEKIHLKQQLELLILPFYLWYGIEFLIRWVQYGTRKQAYRNISFEREAYINEMDLDYLETRTFWSFLRYL